MILQDIRYGFRMLRKNPGFAAVAILTLALGIGANTAMFSVINSVIFHGFSYRDASHVMLVWKNMSNGSPNAFSTPAFLEIRQQGDLLAHLGAFSGVGKNLGGKDVPERVAGGKINYDLLPILGVQPVRGRMFSQEEDKPGAGNVVILSHALWATRFNSRPDILGQSIPLDGVPYTVVGVMPPKFFVMSNTELFWIPLQLESVNAQTSARNVHWIFGFTRLPNGMSQQQMQSALDGIAARLKKQDPTGDGGFGTLLMPVGDYLNGSLKPILMMLMGAVGFVLLIACSNVANLLLARSATRQREISIRAALGASRLRMIRQLLTESALLSVLGGLVGIVLAWVAVKLLQQTPSATIPSAKEIAINPLVLAFTTGLCCLAGILFGIAPAWENSKSNVSETMKEGARGSSGLGKHRALLIVTETALASMLFIGAGLSLRSLWRVQASDLGFNQQDVLTFRLAAPAQFTGERIPLFYEQVLDRLKAVPNIESVVLARNLPMSGGDPSMAISIEGTLPPPSEVPVVTRFRAIGPGYFKGLQTSILSGREFTEQDTRAAQKVAVVSESLAKLYWPKENAIGKRLKPEMPGGDWCVVVGIAADVHHWAVDYTDVEPTAYYPYTQVPTSYLALLEGNMSFAVRSQQASGLLNTIQSTVGAVDKTTPVYLVQSMEQMVSDSGSLRRFNMWLIGAFAGLALSLAAIGIYGVMAYSVSQRTREIGIRVALGARRSNVLMLILLQGTKLALVGVAVGLVGALALAQLMASIVYGVSTRDLATFSLVPWVVFTLILLGCYIPARRAANVDPMVALRYE